MRSWMYKTWKINKTFIIFISLMFVFRSSVADWNEVPTGSMKPTILEGDRIWVNKLAYDVRAPFTHISLFKRSDPMRGDIIIFDSEKSGKRLVKRVVGVAGDLVEMNGNTFKINGQMLAYQRLYGSETDFVENLSGIKHAIKINEQGSYLSNFSPVTVPDGHYFVLGDNRDNSADSRVIGFVPRDEIIGRSRNVVLSLNYENYYIPRHDRFFHRLQ